MGKDGQPGRSARRRRRSPVAIDPDSGTIEVAFDASAAFTNPLGVVQGGFLAAMLDDTLGPALVATLPPGQFAPTLELKVSFLRPARPGRLVGAGRIVHRGGTIAFLEGSLRNADGHLVATATARVVRPKAFGAVDVPSHGIDLGIELIDEQSVTSRLHSAPS